MQSRRLLVGAAAVLTGIAAVATTVSLRQISPRHGAVPAPGKAQLHAYGGRTLQQRAAAPVRMDAALAGIAAHAATIAPATALADLRALNPATRFRLSSSGNAPEVAIDAATHGDAQALESALVALGLEHPAVFANSVGGWLPVGAINAAAARPEVAYIHASMPRRRASVATQGDYAQQSYAVRQAYPSLTGTGVTVGVLSDSFDCYAVYAEANSGVPASGTDGYASNGFTATAADDEASGALPAASAINVLAEPYTSTPSATGNCLAYGAPSQLPFTDEGRAMLQIVHAVAPGANLAFYTGDNSETNFATGITTLASPVSAGGAGAKVIADDLGYFDEPFYQDGIVAQAIDSVEAEGVAYFSAAGNDGNASWESANPSFPVQQASGAANNAGEYLLNFDTTGATTATALPITLSALVPGEYVAIVVEWDQPYVTGAPDSGGATNQIDVCVTGASTGVIVQDYDGNDVTCTGLNATGVDPVQVLIIGNSAAATANTPTQNLMLYVGTSSQTNAPHRVIVSVETDGQTSPAPIASYATNSETIQGHPNAAGAATVAAAFYFDTPQCGTSPAQLEPYSSQGGAPILFSSTGARLATPEVRQKPDFVGPDGVNNTFLGFTLASADITVSTSTSQCQNNPDYPNFFGTSAATPHAAGIAALMLQAAPTITPTQIYTALESSALAIGTVPTNSTYNFNAGYGFIQADAAFATPSMSLSQNSVAVGTTTTLTWSTIEASSCTASGAWTGAENTSGTLSITPTAAGTTTYTLTCTNATGATGTASVSLNVGLAPAAPTLALSATSVPEGASTILTWSSSFATGCTASGNGWSGAQPSSGSEQFTATSLTTQTFTLFCSNSFGASPSTSVSFTVTPPPPPAPTMSLSATSITLGASATLTWSDSGATSCTASGTGPGWSGSEAASGTATETPTAAGNYTYTLVCANANGNSAATTVTLDVTTPTPTATLSASATSIVVGSTATLTWSSTNATGCTASGSWSGTLATSGSQTVTPTATGTDTYTLVCSNGTVNSTAASATVTVTAKPSSGGGGGALDVISLLLLGGVSVVARRRP